MILPIDIASYAASWKEMSKEAYDLLRESVTQLPEEKPEYGVGVIWGGEKELRAIKDAGLECSISKEELSKEHGLMIVKLQERLMNLGDMPKTTENAVLRDAAVQITIPDLGLLVIDEVRYLTDACTDMLQDELDDGWRILAVCPPNAQRRPDYILGRKKQHGNS